MVIKKYFKIAILLFTALLVVFATSKPALHTPLKNLFNKLSGGERETKITKDDIIKELKEKNIKFKKVKPGHYVDNEDSPNYTLIKLDEIEWDYYNKIIDGQTIKYKIPKGKPTPTELELRQVFLDKN